MLETGKGSSAILILRDTGAGACVQSLLVYFHVQIVILIRVVCGERIEGDFIKPAGFATIEIRCRALPHISIQPERFWAELNEHCFRPAGWGYSYYFFGTSFEMR